MASAKSSDVSATRALPAPSVINLNATIDVNCTDTATTGPAHARMVGMEGTAQLVRREIILGHGEIILV